MSGVWKITVLGWNVEELRGLLVLADLPQGHSARTVPVGLLHSSSRRGGFASSLGGQLLPWSLASGGLAGGLLGASHVERGGRCDVNRERGRRVYSRMEFTAEEAEEDDPIDPDVVPPPDVSIPGVALGAADVSIPDVARQAAAERFPPFWRTNDRFSNMEAASYKSEEESEEDLTFAPTESELDRGSDEDADDEDDEDEANMEEDDFEISEGEAAAVAAVWHPPSGIHRLASTTAMFAMMRDVRSPPSSRPLDRHPPSSPRSPPILCLEKEIRKISTPRLLPRPAPTPAPPSTTATSKPTPWGDGFNKGRKKGT